MSRSSANPTAVGAFVLGALAIAVAGILFFGSGELFKQNRAFVCIFRESVDGLQNGSEVTFKGVPVGKVSRIMVRFEPEVGTLGTFTETPTPYPVIPVVFEIDPTRVGDDLGVQLEDDLDFHRSQIDAGLRGKLKTSSLITGMLTLDLDYYPTALSPVVPETSVFNGTEYKVIPSIPSELTALKEQAYQMIGQLSELGIKDLADTVKSVLGNLDTKITELDVEGINETVSTLKETVSAPELKSALESIRTAGDKIGLAADNLTEEVRSWEVNALLSDARTAVTSLDTAIEKIDRLVDGDSTTRMELDRALTKVADAAAEVEELAAYIKEHPNSLVFGRKDEKEPSSRESRSQNRPRKPPGR